MAHYVIYIGGVQGANDEHLRRVGLDGLLADGGASWVDALANTPDGKRGMLASWVCGDPERDPTMTFTPTQKWTPATEDQSRDLAEGRFWVGIDESKPVTPEDLAVSKQHQGHWMELADGNAWLIPTAIRMPHKYKVSRSGKPERVIHDQYKEYYRLAERTMREIFEALDLMDVLEGLKSDTDLSPDPVAVPIEEGVRFCWMALAFNYRLNPEIISILELLDDQSMQRIIAGAIDLPAILATRESKKNYSPVDIPVG